MAIRMTKEQAKEVGLRWARLVKEHCLEEVDLGQVLEGWIGLGEVKMDREAYQVRRRESKGKGVGVNTNGWQVR